MEEYRLIIMSTPGGEKETVIFTDIEKDTPAEEYCNPNQTVDFDGRIKADLPHIFPVNYNLNRE